MNWKDLNNLIEKNNTFLLSSHVNPDGDCIASLLSMRKFLLSKGKKVTIYIKDKVPEKFRFLPDSETIENIFPENKFFDVFVILDSSNPERLGWDGYKNITKSVINIDHHRDNTMCGDVNIVVPDSPATSMVLYNFFTENNFEIDKTVATVLYAGILTDTGGFQFSNTSSEVLRVCANLIDKGANPSSIYNSIYSSFSPQGLALRAKIWSTLTYYFENRVAMLELDYSMIEKTGADYGEVEGMSDLALTAKTVKVGIFAKYYENKTHFSLRSTGEIDVGKLAQNIPGGGGHCCAAGCTIEMPFNDAKEIILNLIKKELDKN